MSKTTNKYSAEVRERAVRMVLEYEGARAIGNVATIEECHLRRQFKNVTP